MRGNATIAYYISGATPGYRVVVSVRVVHGNLGATDGRQARRDRVQLRHRAPGGAARRPEQHTMPKRNTFRAAEAPPRDRHLTQRSGPA